MLATWGVPPATAAASLLVALLLPCFQAQDLTDVCRHEYEANVRQSVDILDGQTVYRDILANQTHLYMHTNYATETMNAPDEYRKLIINLEPCKGVVYLFVRKTRRCYPNPYSCINLASNRRSPGDCEWTHFMSEIDGSRDGTPTFFEVPFSSTKYFISVFATQTSSYTLDVLADIGAFPRPGGNGQLQARQLRELQIQLSWEEATYIRPGITDTRQYWVYSSMLLDTDNRTNMAVFMRPNKIMNTVCGLHNNTDRQYSRVPASTCSGGQCNTTIDGMITKKWYVFNIVAESNRGSCHYDDDPSTTICRGYMTSYAGLIMRTDWEVVRQAASDKTLKVVGAVSGSVLGMVVIIYFMMLKLYG